MEDELQDVGPRKRGTPPAIQTEAFDEGQISESFHRPLHYYLNDSCYWITAATLHHAPYFRGDERLALVVSEIEASAARWKIDCVAWTVLEHHYHLVACVQDPQYLPRFIGRVHGQTARLINGMDNTPGRQVWRQYWDRLLRTEGDFWSRLNYVWWNPVRHEFCARPEQWRWTRMPTWFSDEGGMNAEAREQFPAPKTLPGDRW